MCVSRTMGPRKFDISLVVGKIHRCYDPYQNTKKKDSVFFGGSAEKSGHFGLFFVIGVQIHSHATVRDQLLVIFSFFYYSLHVIFVALALPRRSGIFVYLGPERVENSVGLREMSEGF